VPATRAGVSAAAPPKMALDPCIASLTGAPRMNVVVIAPVLGYAENVRCRGITDGGGADRRGRYTRRVEQRLGRQVSQTGWLAISSPYVDPVVGHHSRPLIQRQPAFKTPCRSPVTSRASVRRSSALRWPRSVSARLRSSWPSPAATLDNHVANAASCPFVKDLRCGSHSGCTRGPPQNGLARRRSPKSTLV
jgi:hypothetical protein